MSARAETATADFAIDARKAAILDARTAMLAAGATAARQRDGRLEFLKIEVGGERYALLLKAVAGVIAARPLGPFRSARPEIIGTLYERAEVWPVYSLSALLGAPAQADETAGAAENFVLLRHESRRAALAAGRIEFGGADNSDFSKMAAASPGSLVSDAAADGLMRIDEGALWRHPALTPAPTNGRLT